MSYLLDPTRRSTVTITVWNAVGIDVTGQATYSAPIQISGEFQYKEEVIVSSSGRQIISNAFIVSLDEIEEGDWVLEGTHADLTPPAAAREVKAKNERIFISQNLTSYRYAL